MADTVTVRLGGPDAALRLARRIADPRPILTSIGAVLVAQARKAFEEQRLGDTLWSERYPQQSEPFVNIAPVVRKAGEGRAPTADDFRRRPALGGASGELAQSVSARVESRAVEVGSTHEGASRAQFGGTSSIAITDTTRATLARWLGIETAEGRGAASRRTVGRGPDGKVVKTEGTGNQYGAKLAFVLDPTRRSMSQGQAARPFIGFLDETEADIRGELATWIEAA